MPHNSFTFRGLKKNWLILTKGRTREPFAPIKRNLIYITGRAGAYLQSNTVQPVAIKQPIGFFFDNEGDLLSKKEELANWLITDDSESLVFDDEPTRTYYALIDGSISNFRYSGGFAEGEIEFLCYDPHKYGPEIPYTFPSDYVSVPNNGTNEAKPVFELEVLTPVTFAMIQNQNDEYMMIGKPTNVEENAPYEKYELIFDDDGSDLTGWTVASAVDGGAVAGVMGTNGNRLEASSYGTGNRWHGPAVKHSLSETLQDFRMETYVELYNNQPGRVGRVEIYLLDENDGFVAKVAMKDIESSQSLAWGEARAGDWSDGHFLINEYGDKPGNWNIFSGVLRIEREGNVWRAYIAKVGTDGRHSSRRSVEWIDSANKYMQRVAKVQVHMAQFASETPVQGGVSYVKVFKINNQPEATPYLANPGDVITFDHKNEEILLNGENAMTFKNFGARFFDLKKGQNELVVHPSNAFNVSMKYRETFK